MLKKLYDLKMIYLIRVVDLDPDPSVLGVFFLRLGYGSAFFLTVNPEPVFSLRSDPDPSQLHPDPQSCVNES